MKRKNSRLIGHRLMVNIYAIAGICSLGASVKRYRTDTIIMIEDKIKIGFSSLIGQCKLDGIYFVFFSDLQKENPTHKHTHLQFARANAQPKIAKEYAFSLRSK